MSEDRDMQLREVLIQFAVSHDSHDEALLEQYIGRFPQYAAQLREFYSQWRHFYDD